MPWRRVFKPEIPNWVNLGSLAIEDGDIFWPILSLFCIFYGHSVYFVEICVFFPVLVCCMKKNMATLPWQHGAVVIASASRTEDPGHESRQGEGS
jgi:hypothetical protein